jgi:tetratricopeptide (TPR) repeat protein
MVRERRRVRGGALLALGLALAAGCQLAPRRLAHSPSAGAEAAPHLSATQAADVQVALAHTLEKRGEAGPAMAAYADALKKDPDRVDALVRLAVLHDRQGEFRESEDLYRRALAARPDDPDLHCNRGYSLYLQQRWAEAEQSLRRAVSLKSDHRRAHNNLGLVLARSGQGAEALEEFHRAGCNKADAHTNLAYGLTLAGEWPEARRHYELALAADPAAQPARKGLRTLAALMKKAGQEEQGLADGGGGGPPGQTPELAQVSFPPRVMMGTPRARAADDDRADRED